MQHDRKATIRDRAAALGLLLLAGCGPAGAPLTVGPAPGRVITGDQIERMGVTTAWEVLERAHVHLGVVEDRDGRPGHLSRRGRRSLSSPGEPLVIVNGIRTAGLGILRDIRGSDIAGILVIGGINATNRYGTGASGGAIVIELKVPTSTP